MASTQSATSSPANSRREAASDDALDSLRVQFENIASGPDRSTTFDDNAAFALAKFVSCHRDFPRDVAQAMSSVINQLSALPVSNIGAYLNHIATYVKDKTKELGILAVQHPKVVFHACLILGIVLLAFSLPHLIVKLVHAVGFEAQGVLAGSVAAAFQSAHLGGHIAQGSAFAALQSVGAVGSLPAVVEAVAVASGIAAAAVAWFKMRL